MYQRYTSGHNRLGQGLGSIVGALLGGGAMQKRGAMDASAMGGGVDRGLAQHQLIAGLTGLDMPKVRQLGDLISNGQWAGTQEMAGPVRPGEPQPMMPGAQPDWFTPDVREKLNLGLMALGLTGMGSPTRGDQLGDMLLNLNKFGVVQRGAAGQMPPPSVAASFGAIAGKPNFSQGSQGVLDVYQGNAAVTPLVAAKIGSENALAAKRGGGGGGGGAGAGKSPASVQFIQFLTGQGMDLQTALRVANTAKMNPLKATIDLAKGIMEAQQYSPQAMKKTPQQAMEEARTIVQGYMKSMEPGMGAPAADDDPLGLMAD
jgi:hypothetical protein